MNALNDAEDWKRKNSVTKLLRLELREKAHFVDYTNTMYLLTTAVEIANFYFFPPSPEREKRNKKLNVTLRV